MQTSQGQDNFAARLGLALKALNLSRGQLAAAVGVDKSLVSRWLAGQVAPSSHNLARISEALAKAKPGFNAVQWDRPLSAFMAFLGIADLDMADARRGSMAGTQAERAGEKPIALRSGALDAQETLVFGHVYPGHYALFRQRFINSGIVHIEAVTIFLDEGRLKGLVTDGEYRVDVQFLLLRGKLWVIGEVESGRLGLALGVLNGSGGTRAMVLDGIVAGISAHQLNAPSAGKVVMLRVADLLGEPEADRARFELMAARIATLQKHGRGGDFLPPRFAEAIDNSVGFRREHAADWVLRVPGETSVARSDLEGDRQEMPAPELTRFLFGEDDA